MTRAQDPGVPEALPRVLNLLGRRLDPSDFDRLWIFPPLRQGRRESGLVAVSLFGAEPDRRRLVTAGYVAELSGQGLSLDPVLREEGEAPPDALPRIIAGVVLRSKLELGDPRAVPLAGDAEKFRELAAEYELDQEAP